MVKGAASTALGKQVSALKPPTGRGVMPVAGQAATIHHTLKLPHTNSTNLSIKPTDARPSPRRRSSTRRSHTGTFEGKYAEALRVNDGLRPLRHHMAAVARLRKDTNLVTLASKFDSGLIDRYSSQHYRSSRNSYVKSCRATGTAPLPVTIPKLKGWMVRYVTVSLNLSSNLPGLYSRFKHYCSARQICWPVWPDTDRVKWMTWVAKAAPAEATHKAGVLEVTHLWKIHSYLLHTDLARTSLKKVTMYVSIVMAATMGFRVGEMMGGNLRVCDLTIIDACTEHRGGVTARKFVSKTRKKRCGEEVVSMAELPGEPPLVPLLRLLISKLSFYHLVSSTDGPQPLFADWDEPSRPLTKAKWAAEFSKVLGASGVPKPQRYTGHGLRAAARTRLARHDVPKQVAQAMLGWGSDISEGYVRLTSAALVSLTFVRHCNKLLSIAKAQADTATRVGDS